MAKSDLPESWIPDAPGANSGHSDVTENDGRQWRIRLWYSGGGVVSFSALTSVKNFVESALLKQFRDLGDMFAKNEPLKNNNVAMFLDIGTIRLLTVQLVAFEIVPEAPPQDSLADKLKLEYLEFLKNQNKMLKPEFPQEDDNGG